MLNPGTYTNKKGESVELKKTYDAEHLLTDGKGNYYQESGLCLVWRTDMERFVMNTDPNSDLKINKPKSFGNCGQSARCGAK